MKLLMIFQLYLPTWISNDDDYHIYISLKIKLWGKERESSSSKSKASWSRSRTSRLGRPNGSWSSTGRRLRLLPRWWAVCWVSRGTWRRGEQLTWAVGLGWFQLRCCVLEWSIGWGIIIKREVVGFEIVPEFAELARSTVHEMHSEY